MTGLIAVVAIVCATFLIALALVLRWSRWLVEKSNGDTKCLRDAAVVLRAFLAGSGSPMLAAICRLLRRS